MKRKRSPKETVTVGNVKVKIYQRTRHSQYGVRQVFEVSDYTSGARVLRSFSTHATARAEAEKVARQLSTGDAAAASMRNHEAASYGRAMELLRPTGLSLELAAATVANCFETLGGNSLVEACAFYQRHGANRITHKPVPEVVTELLAASVARGLSVRHIDDLRQRLGRFAAAFAVNISSLTTLDVQRWLDGLKLAPQSVNNFRRVLHAMFAFAETRGYTFKGSNPVADVKLLSTSGGDIEIYSPDEIAKLLEAASPDFLPMVAIGAFAGLRTSEIQRIGWQDVDLLGGFITVSASKAKTKSRRLTPIQPNLALWLETCPKRTGPVVRLNKDELLAARAACAQASGVAWKPNALRHSYASYRLAQIQNAGQVSLEMGNSPAMIFKHYRELVRPTAAAAWFAIVPQTEQGKAAK